MNVNNDTAHRVPTLQRSSNGQEVAKPRTIKTGSQQETKSEYSMAPDKDKEKQEVKSTVERLNEFNDPVRTNLKFILHDDLEKYYVEVINPSTDEVIREIPPKKMLDMYAEMAKYMGLLVDEKI